MSDITNTPQDQDDAAQDAPAPVTFAIFKEQSVDCAKPMTAPVWRGYVDIPGDDFPDINPETYGAEVAILERWLDLTQPQDPHGSWYIGRLPADDDGDRWGYYGVTLTRVKVESRREVYRG